MAAEEQRQGRHREDYEHEHTRCPECARTTPRNVCASMPEDTHIRARSRRRAMAAAARRAHLDIGRIRPLFYVVEGRAELRVEVPTHWLCDAKRDLALVCLYEGFHAAKAGLWAWELDAVGHEEHHAVFHVVVVRAVRPMIDVARGRRRERHRHARRRDIARGLAQR
eukprot:5117171-Prymnesium_polylepis.1